MAAGVGAVIARWWRPATAVAAALVVLVAAYSLLFAAEEVEPTIRIGFATSAIGAGEDAVGVTPDGEVLVGEPPPEEGTVPQLPATEVPQSGRLSGPMLDQAKVLGAAPEPLRACIARSYLGESGIDVELVGGIELHFGDAARAGEKWVTAIALLADPSITALDYVNVVSPTRPSTGGSGHPLPSTEEGAGSGCGPEPE